jgi:CRP-like cAMP-binding protein
MHVLIRKLTNHHEISEEEQAAVLAVLGPPRQVLRGKDIVPDGSTPKETTVMLAGTACRYKIMANSNRHIFAFQYPGDMTDLYSYVLKKLDHAVGALTPCTVAHILHEDVAELCERYPNLAYAFWRDTMLDGAVSYNWTMSGGRQTIERVAHLLCEIFVRLQAMGLADLHMPLPFTATQKDFADALGLSLVHTNKTLARLTRMRLITRDNSKLRILDWEGLKAVANFDPAYLHFRAAVNGSIRPTELTASAGS